MVSPGRLCNKRDCYGATELQLQTSMSLPMTVPERRQTPRAVLREFAYINIEANNGGSVLNVSEGGFCFHSIGPVQKNGTIRFWFAEHNRRFEGAGKLTWTDEAKKIGGVQFTALPAGAREQIRKWMTLAATPVVAKPTAVPSLSPSPDLPLSNVERLEAKLALESSPLLAEVPAPALQPRSGFSSGLAIGLLVSTLVAAIFLIHDYRRELGVALIRLGEQFVSKPEERAQAAPASQGQNLASAETLAPPPAAAPVAQTSTPTLEKEETPHAQQPAPPKAAATEQTLPASSPKPSLAKQDTSSASQSAARVPAQPTPTPSQNVAPPPSANTVPLQEARLDLPAPPAVQPPVNANLSPAANAPAAVSADIPSATPDKPGSPQVEVAGSADQGETVSERFFEIGNFKDQSGAQKATDQLADLGFHANLVQKGHLWKSSYRVMVGPYGDDDRAETAHQNLVSKGFKPRPFEKGSRTLTLRPGLTLHGARFSGGDCTISWESYVMDATVKFEQDNWLVATTIGKWVKHDVKYRRDAFVYRKNGDGTRMLLEIQFAGMTRSLVLG